MLAFGLRGDVRVVRSGSANGTKHLSSDLLWSTPDSVIHAVWLYSLWECILTSKRRRRSCPRRHLPAIFLRFALVSIKNLKTHQFYYQIFWGPGPLTSLPMVRPPYPTRRASPNRTETSHRRAPLGWGSPPAARCAPRCPVAAATFCTSPPPHLLLTRCAPAAPPTGMNTRL